MRTIPLIIAGLLLGALPAAAQDLPVKADKLVQPFSIGSLKGTVTTFSSDSAGPMVVLTSPELGGLSSSSEYTVEALQEFDALLMWSGHQSILEGTAGSAAFREVHDLQIGALKAQVTLLLQKYEDFTQVLMVSVTSPELGELSASDDYVGDAVSEFGSLYEMVTGMYDPTGPTGPDEIRGTLASKDLGDDEVYSLTLLNDPRTFICPAWLLPDLKNSDVDSQISLAFIATTTPDEMLIVGLNPEDWRENDEH